MGLEVGFERVSILMMELARCGKQGFENEKGDEKTPGTGISNSRIAFAAAEAKPSGGVAGFDGEVRPVWPTTKPLPWSCLAVISHGRRRHGEQPYTCPRLLPGRTACFHWHGTYARRNTIHPLRMLERSASCRFP